MSDINRVFLIGRLTKEPEYKIVNNTALANFTVANNKTYNKDGEKKSETSFFDCVAWGKLAEIIKQYAKKGQQVAIEGRLQQQSWTTPEGAKKSKIVIQIENFQMLGSKSKEEGNQDQPMDTDPDDLF